jgi:NAD(P)-dependent dehydrogenase (short-subunit alcohol dehydrogenase family)
VELNDKIVVITGAASGIGAALGRACLAAGARAVVGADLRTEGMPQGCEARQCDVMREEEIIDLVRATESRHGRVDVFCSNAGILTPGWDVREADFALWERDWRINVLSHAMAAKTVLPGMIARGEGYLLNTASAGGLLAAPETMIYTTTKHAAVGLAEFLAFTYRRYGIRVSALCPMGVRTPMLENIDESGASAGLDGVLSADEVAAAAIAGMREERFLIFPHPKVADYYLSKATRHDKWLKTMEILQAQFTNVGKP